MTNKKQLTSTDEIKKTDAEEDTVEVAEIVAAEPLEMSLPENFLDFADAAEPSASREITRYDPLQSYLAEIGKFQPLSREEEHHLALRYFESGDSQAAYRLIVANLRLVVLIAREYQKSAQNILDLVQEGNIGLLQAVKQFDPYRGIRFPSYAVYWVRAYMLRYLINNLRLVKIGTTQAQRKLFFNLRKEKEKLEAEGFVPEAKLLAERLQVKEAEVVEMEQRLSLPEVSVDAKVGNDDDARDLHSILANQQDSAEEILVKEQFATAVRQTVEEFKKNLDEKEQVIIDQRLFAEDPVTLQVIADRFGLSRERIRQLESRLKKQLKAYLAEKLQLSDAGEVVIDAEND